MSVSTKEGKAVLELTKYFGDHWCIIDVGANKGTWSDILMDYRDSSVDAGKYSVTMIEPNRKLCDYLDVKYDYNGRVTVLNIAADKERGVSDFFYWENRHNGLSSVHDNPKWRSLPGRKRMKVETASIDDVLQGEIDILKIDVEGAEMDVLRGCEFSLGNRNIKFIQIEYSEHYKLAGFTFKDVIDFAAQFGYHAWWFDGEYFIKQDKDAFVEDYRLDNFILTYLDIGRYHYTQLWNNEFQKNTKNIGPFHFALEIGCFEGLTSNYICDHLLDKSREGSRLICVDPLEDRYMASADKETNDMFVGQYERFIHNTRGQPIELQRCASRDAFPLFHTLRYKFDFVYVDGDHTGEGVLFDGIESFKLLKVGGYILFDDYLWRPETAYGIDKFILLHDNKISVVMKNYQVLIKKIA